MEMSDLTVLINLGSTIIMNVFAAMDSVDFITSPKITLLDLELGLTIFGEIWYFMINVKDGE